MVNHRTSSNWPYPVANPEPKFIPFMRYICESLTALYHGTKVPNKNRIQTPEPFQKQESLIQENSVPKPLKISPQTSDPGDRFGHCLLSPCWPNSQRDTGSFLTRKLIYEYLRVYAYMLILIMQNLLLLWGIDLEQLIYINFKLN